MDISIALQQAIAAYLDPVLGTDFITAKALQKAEIKDHHISIELLLGFPIARYKAQLIHQLSEHIHKALGETYQIHIQVASKIVPHQVQKGQTSHLNIKNIIAVASGKGGVGKSTVAVNVALALQKEGAVVGILDADIYGPSQPRLLGIKQQPVSSDIPKHVLPLVSHGLYSMSIGYWIDDEQPMIWRGPMVSGALKQLMEETDWPELDYLIVDLPPGTGDIQLTLAQKIPVSGAIIVTTPQELAVLDARKAYGMLQKVDIPILGIVENMSYYECRHCDQREAIFGTEGGANMAKQYHIPLLGQLPLEASIGIQADNGCPTVAADPDGRLAGLYFDVARKMTAQLSLRPRSYGSLFGKVTVE